MTVMLDAMSSPYCFPVTVVNDMIVEGIEVFMLELSSDDPVVDFTHNNASVSILDDDSELILITHFTNFCCLHIVLSCLLIIVDPRLSGPLWPTVS